MTTTLTLADPTLLREHCFIDGQWVSADDGATFPVTNPASGTVIGHVPRCGAAETRRAIEAAKKAMVGWAATPAKARGKMLRKFADLLLANAEDLGRLMTADHPA